MDIIVQRELLLKPLQALSGIVEKKQTLPLLANVLLSIKDNQLWLTGTDMEIELIGFVPIIEQHAGGVTTVSARKLFDICRALPEGCQVRLLLEKNHLIVRAADSNFKLNTLPPDEFPNLEDCDYRVHFSLKQAALKNLFATVTDRVRLKGIDSGDHYGLKNLNEFIAEAFSNPNFQEFLHDLYLVRHLLQNSERK